MIRYGFRVAFTLLALAPALPSSAADPVTCDCGAPLDSVGVVRTMAGKVFVSQETGMSQPQPDSTFSLPARIVTGPRSSLTIEVGGLCRMSIAENQMLRIQNEDGIWCAHSEAAPAVAPAVAPGPVAAASTFVAPAGKSAGPAVIVGGLIAQTTFFAIAHKDQRVSR